MKVYVVESGEYSQRRVTAVYSSLEKAMGRTDPETWQENTSGEIHWWSRKTDDDCDITEFQVDAD